MLLGSSRTYRPMDRLRFIIALGMFAVIAWAASLPITHGWDRIVTVWLQRVAPAPDVPASTLVFLGDAEIVILGVALGAFIYLRRNRRRLAAGLWLAVGLGGASLLAVLLKHLIIHPGPPPELQRSVLRFGLYVRTPYSFPSGHTIRTTMLARILLRRAPLVAGTLVVGMMAALIYLGDHWLSDVLGGLCLGWACTEIAEGSGKLNL